MLQQGVQTIAIGNNGLDRRKRVFVPYHNDQKEHTDKIGDSPGMRPEGAATITAGTIYPHDKTNLNPQPQKKRTGRTSPQGTYLVGEWEFCRSVLGNIKNRKIAFDQQRPQGNHRYCQTCQRTDCGIAAAPDKSPIATPCTEDICYYRIAAQEKCQQ